MIEFSKISPNITKYHQISPNISILEKCELHLQHYQTSQVQPRIVQLRTSELVIERRRKTNLPAQLNLGALRNKTRPHNCTTMWSQLEEDIVGKVMEQLQWQRGASATFRLVCR
eukprot:7033605-Pyramimonas_sp.AAC.1